MILRDTLTDEDHEGIKMTLMDAIGLYLRARDDPGAFLSELEGKIAQMENRRPDYQAIASGIVDILEKTAAEHMKGRAFKVGDRIRMNAAATDRFRLTKEGSIGEILECYDGAHKVLFTLMTGNLDEKKDTFDIEERYLEHADADTQVSGYLKDYLTRKSIESEQDYLRFIQAIRLMPSTPLMRKGCQVRLRKDSKFARQNDGIGIMLNNFGDEGSGIEGRWARVEFTDGYSNNYRRQDLEPAEQQALDDAKMEMFARARQSAQTEHHLQDYYTARKDLIKEGTQKMSGYGIRDDKIEEFWRSRLAYKEDIANLLNDV